ncbi:MAG: YhbY family RNA-binding protein [Mycoplasmatales bacterium]
MTLTSKQKAEVRKRAQLISATFQVGGGSIHETFLKALDEGFTNVEIIKLKVNRIDKTDSKITKEIANEISTKLKDVNVCGVIGTTIILYKQNKDPEKRMKF